MTLSFPTRRASDLVRPDTRAMTPGHLLDENMASRQAWVTLRHHIELRRAVASCDRVADVARNVEGERVPFSHAEGTVGKLRGAGDEVAAVGRDCANHAPDRKSAG